MAYIPDNFYLNLTIWDTIFVMYIIEQMFERSRAPVDNFCYDC